MAKTIKTFYDSQIPSHQRREFTCRIHKKICFRLPTDNTKGEKFYWVNRSCLRIGSDWAETGDCVTFLIVLVSIAALLKHQVGRNSYGDAVWRHMGSGYKQWAPLKSNYPTMSKAHIDSVHTIVSSTFQSRWSAGLSLHCILETTIKSIGISWWEFRWWTFFVRLLFQPFRN